MISFWIMPCEFLSTLSRVTDVVPLVTSVVFKVISFPDELYPNSSVEESEPDLETSLCKRASGVPPPPPLASAKSISF